MKSVHADAALLPGCELWIVADAEASSWSRRIDWLLNFQMRRSEFHKRREISSEVEKLSSEFEIEVPQIATPAHLMVASGSLVPARQTVMVPIKQTSSEAWIRSCHELWSQLGKPLARVFLPDGIPADFFNRHWPVTSDEGLRGDRGLEVVV